MRHLHILRPLRLVYHRCRAVRGQREHLAHARVASVRQSDGIILEPVDKRLVRLRAIEDYHAQIGRLLTADALALGIQRELHKLCRLLELLGGLKLIIRQPFLQLVDFHLVRVIHLALEILRVRQGHQRRCRRYAELGKESGLLLRLPNLAKAELVLERLGQALKQRRRVLLVSEQQYFILGRVISHERLVVLAVHRAYEALHLAGSRLRDALPSLLAGVHGSLVDVLLSEDLDRRVGVNEKFFAELLVLAAVDGADTEDAEHLRRQRFVLLLELVPLFLRVHEKDDPDLLAAVECADASQVHGDYISVLERIRRGRFSALPAVSERVATTAKVELSASSAHAAAAEELREHVVHVHVGAAATSALPVDAFLAALVVHSSFLFIGQNLVSICNFGKLLLCGLRIVFILVRVVLNRQFLERLLNLSVCGFLLDAKDLVVVLAGRLLLLLLLLALSATSTEVLVESLGLDEY